MIELMILNPPLAALVQNLVLIKILGPLEPWVVSPGKLQQLGVGFRVY